MKFLLILLFALIFAFSVAREKLTEAEIQLLLNKYLQVYDKEIADLEEKLEKTVQSLTQLKKDYGEENLSESQMLTIIQYKQWVNQLEDKLEAKKEEKNQAAQKFLADKP